MADFIIPIIVIAAWVGFRAFFRGVEDRADMKLFTVRMMHGLICVF